MRICELYAPESPGGQGRPVKRGTGCGAAGDERQALGKFTSQLVEYAHTASEAHEQQLIELNHPNAFVRNPLHHKKEWDALQVYHPKIMMVALPAKGSMSLADTEAFGEVMADIYSMGEPNDPPYLKIQMFHAEKLKTYIATGGKKEDFKCKNSKGLLDHLVMPSNSLLYFIDPMVGLGGIP